MLRPTRSCGLYSGSSMHLASTSLSAATAVSGAVGLVSVLLLVASRTPLGSPLFFGLVLIFVLAYFAMLWRVWHEDANDRRAIRLALIFAVLFRLPLALAPVGADSDMVRYLWDGRVQQRGYNPYAVVPSDPAMAATHTSESERMPSRGARTPVPPRRTALFSTRRRHPRFDAGDEARVGPVRHADDRGPVAMADSDRMQRVADARVCVESVRRDGGRAQRAHRWPRRALARAAAYWLTRRRTALATIAYVLAVATKFLPIVLAPLFVGRIRVRDAAIGVALLALLYLQFYGLASPGTDAGAHQRRPAGRRSQRRRLHSLQRAGVPRDCVGELRADCRRCGCGCGARRGRAGALAASGHGSRCLGMADGGRAGVRAGHLPVVSALPDAVPLDPCHVAAPRLVFQRTDRLRRLGSVTTRRAVDCTGRRSGI